MSYFKVVGKKLTVTMLLIGVIASVMCYAESEPVTKGKECLEFITDARTADLFLSMGINGTLEERYPYAAREAQWLEDMGFYHYLTFGYLNLSRPVNTLNDYEFKMYVERRAFIEYLRGFYNGQVDIITWGLTHNERN